MSIFHTALYIIFKYLLPIFCIILFYKVLLHEDGQKLRPKHVRAIHNNNKNIVQKYGSKYRKYKDIFILNISKTTANISDILCFSFGSTFNKVS